MVTLLYRLSLSGLENQTTIYLKIYKKKSCISRKIIAIRNRFLELQIWCPEAESNHRHEDFQSSALPTELSGHINFFCIMIAHSLVLRTILRHCLKTTSLFLPLPYTDYRYLGIFNIMISLYYVNGRGRRNRTLISGFGDRHSTIELYPYNTNSF